MKIGRFIGFLLLAVVVAALGIGGGYFGGMWHDRSTAPDDSQWDNADDPQWEPQAIIEAQGRIEPAEGTIAVSALPGEQIKSIDLEVGSHVTEGQELAVLGSAEIREAEYELAVAQREQARIKRQSELQLSAQKIAAAELGIQLAAAREKELPPEDLKQVLIDRKELAKTQLETLQRLRDNPATREAITATELEQQRLLIQQLEAEILQATKKTDAAATAQDLAMQVANLDLAIAEMGQAAIERSDPQSVFDWTTRLAERTRNATKVVAPGKGTVLEIYVREGERVANTPILLMADLERMVCVAEVHEARLKDIVTEEQNGKLVPSRDYPVTIRSVALETPLRGKVIEVGRLIGAPKLRDPNPLARSDLRTAEVKIELDEDSQEAARRYVHLQVNVTIEVTPTED